MYRRRRVNFYGLIVALVFLGVYIYSENQPQPTPIGQTNVTSSTTDMSTDEVIQMLNALPQKGRAPKTGYARNQFGNGWSVVEGCDTRNTILARDLVDIKMGEDCKVEAGILNDPYTGLEIPFTRGPKSSSEIQIDHVVALSNSWQTGAALLDEADRIALANDPLNLLAVSGPENQIKSDADAATWLPKYKPFRCQYVSRQVQVKNRYDLWVTPSEKKAMLAVLQKCD